MEHLAQTEADRELSALVEEYRALYDLVVFRMSALDRRAPVTAGLFGVAIASLQAMPASTQLFVFIATPLALMWLMRTTVNHARSFEDVVRRIEWIEREVNRRVGKSLIGFQSTHPSRGVYVGGRTGRESVLAVFGSTMLLVAGIGYQFFVTAHGGTWINAAYAALLILAFAASIRELWKLARYHYRPSTSVMTH